MTRRIARTSTPARPWRIILSPAFLMPTIVILGVSIAAFGMKIATTLGALS